MDENKLKIDSQSGKEENEERDPRFRWDFARKKKTFWNGWDAKHILYVMLLLTNFVFMVGFNYAKLLSIENNILEMKKDLTDAKAAIAVLNTKIEVNTSTDATQQKDIDDLKRRVYK